MFIIASHGVGWSHVALPPRPWDAINLVPTPLNLTLMGEDKPSPWSLAKIVRTPQPLDQILQCFLCFFHSSNYHTPMRFHAHAPENVEGGLEASSSPFKSNLPVLPS